MKRHLLNVGAAVAAVLLLWIFVSWGEVVSKNLTPNPTYWKYNIFVLMTEDERG